MSREMTESEVEADRDQCLVNSPARVFTHPPREVVSLLTLAGKFGPLRGQKLTKQAHVSATSLFLQALTHKLNTHLAHKANGYWCWAYPEEALDHWHSYEGGFSSRVPLALKPQAHHA